MVVFGLILWPFIYLITMLIFTVLTAIVNLAALGIGKLLRSSLRIRGSWSAGVAWATAVGAVARSLAALSAGFSAFWYAIFWSWAPVVSTVALAVAVGIAVLVWAPCTFLSSLFGSREVQSLYAAYYDDGA